MIFSSSCRISLLDKIICCGLWEICSRMQWGNFGPVFGVTLAQAFLYDNGSKCWKYALQILFHIQYCYFDWCRPYRWLLKLPILKFWRKCQKMKEFCLIDPKMRSMKLLLSLNSISIITDHLINDIYDSSDNVWLNIRSYL